LLSGGLDSSILFRICQEEMGINESYSTGYPFDDDSDNREKHYALSAAKEFNSDHTYFDTENRDYLISFIDTIAKAEEPIMHLGSAMDNLLFERGIPEEKRIIINGQGADCVWGTVFHLIHNRNNKPFFRFMSHHPFIDIAEQISRISNKGQGFVSSIKTQKKKKDLPLSDPENLFWDFDQYGNKEWICQYYNTNQQELIRNRYSIMETYSDRSFYDKVSLIDAISDISTTQNIWSKIGEAHERILYYPFFHKDMLDTAFSIPWEIKLKRPKRILYEIAKKHKISSLITDRPKSAFAAKPKKWAEKGALLESFVPLASKVINEDEIRKMQSSEPTKAMTFFNMLNYCIWKRLIIQGEPTEKLIEEIIW
jgi:asparagine synthetase B (glutamine-hydrolysing)